MLHHSPKADCKNFLTMFPFPPSWIPAPNLNECEPKLGSMTLVFRRLMPGFNLALATYSPCDLGHLLTF